MKYILIGLFAIALIWQARTPADINNSVVYAEASPVQAQLTSKHIEASPHLAPTAEPEQEIPETVFCGTPAQRNTKRPVRENALLGKKIAKDYGWIGDEWTALLELYSCESSWNHSANNAESGACGIPQSYPCSKLANAIPDYRNNVAGQITWGYEYIKARYGTPSKALAFHYKSNWY